MSAIVIARPSRAVVIAVRSAAEKPRAKPSGASAAPVNAQQYMSRIGKAHADFRTTLAQKKRMAEQQHVQNLRAFTKSIGDSVEDMKKMEIAFASALLDAIIPEQQQQPPPPAGTDDAADKSKDV